MIRAGAADCRVETNAALLRAGGDGLCGERENWPGLGWEIRRRGQGLWLDHTFPSPWRSVCSPRREIRGARSADCKPGAGGRILLGEWALDAFVFLTRTDFTLYSG